MIKNQKDFWAGILFAVFGVVTVILAQENAMGTLSRMGPAYFPTVLGVFLALLGVIISALGLFRRPADGSTGHFEPIKWGVLLLVLAGPAAFALTLMKGGLLVAIFLLIAISSLADQSAKKLEIVILSCVVSALIWLLFVYGIGLQVPVLPYFFNA